MYRRPKSKARRLFWINFKVGDTMNFLTERTKFQCMASPLVNFTISESCKVEHKNSTVLTTSTKLSGDGTCLILTAESQGVKQPCQFYQTRWVAFDFTRKADGKNILTDKSFCLCSNPLCAGVQIKVLTSRALGFQSGNFSAPSVANLAALPPLSSNTVNSSQREISKQNSDDKQENEIDSAKSDTKKETEYSKYVLKCLTCTEKKCTARRTEFGTFDANPSWSSDTPSAKLNENYKKHNDRDKQSKEKLNAADIAYNDSKELDGGWSHQAHHLVSVKQAFAKFPELVKVANACGYDINCARNCIMLPSYEEGHGNLSKDDKKASAYRVMALTGMQWHVSHHGHPIEDEEVKRQVYKYLGRRVKIKTYEELLTEKVGKIKIPEDGVICPKEILNALNKISDTVREKLAAFKDNPKLSYPYYVSREAYAYAFKLSLLGRAFAKGRGGIKLVGRRIKNFISD